MNATSSLFVNVLLNPSFNLSNFGIFFISLGILTWSVIVYRSCGSKSDRENHKEIKEAVDAYSFRQTVVPLYKFLSENLTEEIVTNIDALEITDKKELLKECDKLRVGILNKRDFSLVSGIPELISALDRVVIFRKITKRYTKLSGWLLCLSIIGLVLGLIAIFLYTPLIPMYFTIIALALWVTVLVAWIVVWLIFLIVERKMNTLASL